MIERLIGESIQFSVAHPDARSIVGDAAVRWSRVVMNLSLNARDAMPSAEPTIRTKNATDADRLLLIFRPHVLMTIRDTGTAWTRGTKGIRFDRSSHQTGRQGDGLGLSTVLWHRQAARRIHHRRQRVGKGTTFRIFRPHLLELLRLFMRRPRRARRSSAAQRFFSSRTRTRFAALRSSLSSATAFTSSKRHRRSRHCLLRRPTT